jgi:hypothetical protein
MPYSALQLTDQSRNMVLATFPPKNPAIKADHVTVYFPSRIVSTARELKVIGYLNAPGMQVLAVKVDNSRFRKDKKLFHLTLSYDPTRYKPVDSERVLRENKVNYFHDKAFTLQFTPVIVETN